MAKWRFFQDNKFTYPTDTIGVIRHKYVFDTIQILKQIDVK